MTEKAKAARRAYKRAWQRENKDKCKKYMDRYWDKKAAAAEEAEAAAVAAVADSSSADNQANAEQESEAQGAGNQEITDAMLLALINSKRAQSRRA